MSSVDESPPGSSAADPEKEDSGDILDVPEIPGDAPTAPAPCERLLAECGASSEGAGNTPQPHGNKTGEECPAEVSSTLPSTGESFENLATLAVLQNLRDLACEFRTVENPVIPMSFPEPLSIGRVVMKQNSDSLRNLRMYASSDSDSCKEAEMTDFVADKDWQVGSNDSSDVEFFDCDEEGGNRRAEKSRWEPLNPLGEDMSMLPLPDLSGLTIDCDKEEFLLMGEVASIITDIVTIHALPNTPAYDLDTILFIMRDSKRVPLGAIVDVIGPVTNPIYCVRIDVKEGHSLSAGLKVYSAPKSNLTHYVFVRELMKIKGSDASWLHDQEMPPEVAEDDSSEEEESVQPSRRQHQQQHRKRRRNSPERHQNFERSMNRLNSLNTRATRLADNIRQYNAAHSANRIMAPRPSYNPGPPVLFPYPPTAGPPIRTFVPRVQGVPALRPEFYSAQGNGNRYYPGPSRLF